MIDEFHPSRATLRLQEVDHGGSMIEVHDIDMYDVHAVFFVRSLAIYRTFRLTDRFAPSQPAPDAGGTRIRVHFIWGEALDGVVYGPLAGRTGFFLYPLGALGRAYNIERVYVTRKSVTKLERLDAERSPNAAEG